MKILYAYNLYQRAGGENLWFESEPDLFRARGHEVVVFRKDNTDIESYSPWSKVAMFWRVSWSREVYESVRGLIRAERPDVAHVYNTLALITPSIYYACRDEGVPIVQSIYNYRLMCPEGTFLRKGQVCEECLDHSLWRSAVHGCYRNSHIASASLAWMLARHRRMGTWNSVIDRYLTPTEFLRGKLVEGGIPESKIVVKPNWHEPDPGPREATDGSVLYVGKLAQEKGILTLLKAWGQVENPTKLRIIGDGYLRPEVERAAASSENIEFLGWRPHAGVISWLKRASVFVVPSEWYEAFPHTILESFACGVPILATRIGTLKDIIRDGETGLLFEPGKASDLASKLSWALKESGRAQSIGMAGRKEYEGKYTGKCAYEQLLRVYSSLRSAQ